MPPRKKRTTSPRKKQTTSPTKSQILSPPKKQAPPEGRTPKPPNGFLIFRKVCRECLSHRDINLLETDISKLAGDLWNELPSHLKHYFPTKSPQSQGENALHLPATRHSTRLSSKPPASSAVLSESSLSLFDPDSSDAEIPADLADYIFHRLDADFPNSRQATVPRPPASRFIPHSAVNVTGCSSQGQHRSSQRSGISQVRLIL